MTPVAGVGTQSRTRWDQLWVCLLLSLFVIFQQQGELLDHGPGTSNSNQYVNRTVEM